MAFAAVYVGTTRKSEEYYRIEMIGGSKGPVFLFFFVFFWSKDRSDIADLGGSSAGELGTNYPAWSGTIGATNKLTHTVRGATVAPLRIWASGIPAVGGRTLSARPS